MLRRPLALAMYVDASIAKIQGVVPRELMVKAQVVQDTKEVMRIDGGRRLLREWEFRLARESQEEGTSDMSTGQYFGDS